MSKIGILQFNNYFNRKIMRRTSWAEYVADSAASEIYSFINFNPNDDVSAELILNFLPEDIQPDYLVVFDDEDTYAENPISRWFILDAIRTVQGQYKMRLRRDVIADNYDGVIDADCFIQKATLSDDDPLVVNDEGVSLNQIKKEEILLKDKTESAWIVGYIPTNLPSVTLTYQTETPMQYTTPAEIASATGIPSSIVEKLLRGDAGVRAFTENMVLRYIFKYGGAAELDNATDRGYLTFDETNEAVKYTVWENVWTIDDTWESLYRQERYQQSPHFIEDVMRKFGEKLIDAGFLLQNIAAVLNPDGLISKKQYENLKAFNGRVVQYGNEYKIIRLSYGSPSDLNPKSIRGTTVSNIASALSWLLSNSYIADLDNSARVEVDGKTIGLQIVLEDYQAAGTVSTTISGAGNHPAGKPYRIFCMPYNDLLVANSPDNENFVSLGNVCRGIAGKMQLNLGSDNNPIYLYDIQILPYFPLQDFILYDFGQNRPFIRLDSLEEGTYSYIKDANDQTKTKGIIIYLDDDSFIVELEKTLGLNDSMKVDSNCDMWRITSPNYQGSFEFNVAKNGGVVNGFKAYCTYRPYTPFIKVTPNLGFLYGYDFNDNRGLICSGDFSLPQSSNAWNTYQLNNKNYQNIFNREIQNLSFNQNIEMRNQLISSAVGVLGDTAKGASVGSAAGPWGAIAGAIIGGGSSIAGAVIDTNTLAAVHKETRDFAIDRFNYTLGNIKAIPNTITKVGSWDISSKIWPFLEHYQASDEEIASFKEKIRLDGMTVMRIGKIRDYISEADGLRYIKAEMIRAESIIGDSHIYMAVYEELRKGVYI